MRRQAGSRHRRCHPNCCQRARYTIHSSTANREWRIAGRQRSVMRCASIRRNGGGDHPQRNVSRFPHRPTTTRRERVGDEASIARRAQRANLFQSAAPPPVFNCGADAMRMLGRANRRFAKRRSRRTTHQPCDPDSPVHASSTPGTILSGKGSECWRTDGQQSAKPTPTLKSDP